MADPDVDLERALHDPEYRREVIERLNREAAEGARSSTPPAQEGARGLGRGTRGD